MPKTEKWVKQSRNHALGKQLLIQVNLADFKKAISFTSSFISFMDRSKLFKKIEVPRVSITYLIP